MSSLIDRISIWWVFNSSAKYRYYYDWMYDQFAVVQRGTFAPFFNEFAKLEIYPKITLNNTVFASFIACRLFQSHPTLSIIVGKLQVYTRIFPRKQTYCILHNAINYFDRFSCIRAKKLDIPKSYGNFTVSAFY